MSIDSDKNSKYGDSTLIIDEYGNTRPHRFLNHKFYEQACKVPQDQFPILEIFRTMEGEGSHIGTPRVLVRTAGCAIKCAWCDTLWSWSLKHATFVSLEQTLKQIEEHAAGYAKEISFTGGEVMHYPVQAMWLAERLKRKKYMLSLETSGLIFNDEVFSLFDFLSVDIKTPSSGVTITPEMIDMYKEMRQNYSGVQFKCVILNSKDIEWVNDNLKDFYVNGHRTHKPLILTPGVQNTDRSKEKGILGQQLMDAMELVLVWNKQYNIRVIPQIHQLLKFR